MSCEVKLNAIVKPITSVKYKFSWFLFFVYGRIFFLAFASLTHAFMHSHFIPQSTGTQSYDFKKLFALVIVSVYRCCPCLAWLFCWSVFRAFYKHFTFLRSLFCLASPRTSVRPHELRQILWLLLLSLYSSSPWNLSSVQLQWMC